MSMPLRAICENTVCRKTRFRAAWRLSRTRCPGKAMTGLVVMAMRAIDCAASRLPLTVPSEASGIKQRPPPAATTCPRFSSGSTDTRNTLWCTAQRRVGKWHAQDSTAKIKLKGSIQRSAVINMEPQSNTCTAALWTCRSARLCPSWRGIPGR